MVTIEKDGFRPESVAVTKSMGAAVAGNLIAGGLVGWGVDAMSGAQYNLNPTTINVRLSPLAAGGSPVAANIQNDRESTPAPNDRIHDGAQKSELPASKEMPQPGAQAASVNPTPSQSSIGSTFKTAPSGPSPTSDTIVSSIPPSNKVEAAQLGTTTAESSAFPSSKSVTVTGAVSASMPKDREPVSASQGEVSDGVLKSESQVNRSPSRSNASANETTVAANPRQPGVATVSPTSASRKTETSRISTTVAASLKAPISKESGLKVYLLDNEIWVASVGPATAAAAIGIRPGDKVVSFDREAIVGERFPHLKKINSASGSRQGEVEISWLSPSSNRVRTQVLVWGE